jgi:hypothetical protein
MAASINDKITDVALFTKTELASPGHTSGGTSINANDLSAWPTAYAVYFCIDKVDAAGVRVAGTYTEWEGIVSGNTIGSMVYKGGDGDQDYSAGSTTRVYMGLTVAWGEALAQGIRTHANPDGTLIAQAIKDALGVTSDPAGGWSLLSTTPTFGANAGQKDQTLIFASTDLTGTVPVGAKIKVTRSTTPPTQCMAFSSASSQYAIKTSPTGLAQTNNFTLESWVYPLSYTQGVIEGRVDATPANGYFLRMESDGRLAIAGLNGGGANTRAATTNQSLRLKTWAHVAATWSSGTLVLYINGAVATSVTTTSGTAPTTVGTGGDFAIGRLGASNTQFFDGYISETRVWSAVRTQAEIQANMAINLAGSETNLVGLWKGNGVFTDATSNGNNLTANGGAIATQAANPYNATEYGIVTKVAYSSPNTTVTVFTGNGYSIPNATLSNPFYSTHKTPFGFPTERGMWTIEVPFTAQKSVSFGATSSWFNSGAKIVVPTGKFNTGYSVNAQLNSTVSGSRNGIFTLADSTLLPITNGVYTQALCRRMFAPASTDAIGFVAAETLIDSSAGQSTFEFAASIFTASGTEIYYICAGNSYSKLYAECPYV